MFHGTTAVLSTAVRSSEGSGTFHMGVHDAKRIIDHDMERSNSAFDVRGPCEERLNQSGEYYSVGDDKMGRQVYTFLDSPLDRLYGRLVRGAKTENKVDRLKFEYDALTKYHRLFIESGLIGSIGAVDPNRTYSPNPFGRTFLATTEHQFDVREEYQRAKYMLDHHPTLGHVPGIVVDNVVCHGNSLEVSGYCVGKNSKTRAIAAAEMILRNAGYDLGEMWRKK